jgi:hypothetical protein
MRTDPEEIFGGLASVLIPCPSSFLTSYFILLPSGEGDGNADDADRPQMPQIRKTVLGIGEYVWIAACALS